MRFNRDFRKRGLVDDRPAWLPAGASLLLDYANNNGYALGSGIALPTSLITFTRATSRTYFNSAGVLSTAAINTPAIDYNPVTLACRGLSVWEARTNLLTYSEAFSNAAWNATANTTITANSAVAPDGTTTADTLTHTSASIFGKTGITISAGASLALSLFVKKGNTTFFRLRIDNGADVVSCWFNLDTGATATNTAGSGNVLFSSKSITQVSAGLYRVNLVVTTTVVTTVGATWACAQADSGSATAADFAYLWGAQLEAGSSASPYIPTTTAQVTRAADVAVISGANFSTWYNQTEGTFVAETDVVGLYASGAQYQLSAGTSGTNEIRLRYVDAFISAQIHDGSGETFSSMTAASANTSYKLVLGYKANDSAASLNGSTATTDTTVALPASPNALSIGSKQTGNTFYLNGHIRRITYYPTRLPNAVIQSLSA